MRWHDLRLDILLKGNVPWISFKAGRRAFREEMNMTVVKPRRYSISGIADDSYNRRAVTYPSEASHA